ncbi:MAG TPA: L-threonylcarbamoyladenylate synthase [Candidatus Limnocylindrales bacterium]|nr:L-threonylcarbamoyladenylate synthase [Candidatus Limnocylindrales bacterium]
MTPRISASDPRAIDEAVAALHRGELIAIPTETVYGLAVLPTTTGLERLIAAKHRSAEKGVQLLIDSIDQATALADVTPAARALAARYWPGPLTIVLSRRTDVEVPETLGGGRPTLGLRLPDHDVPRAIARALGPIAASSANVSGEPDATTADHVAGYFSDEISLIVDDGPVRGGVPSTVVSCADAGQPPQVLREGAISAAEISAVAAD